MERSPAEIKRTRKAQDDAEWQLNKEYDLTIPKN
jgi:hypothetical protein